MSLRWNKIFCAAMGAACALVWSGIVRDAVPNIIAWLGWLGWR